MAQIDLTLCEFFFSFWYKRNGSSIPIETHKDGTRVQMNCIGEKRNQDFGLLIPYSIEFLRNEIAGVSMFQTLLNIWKVDKTKMAEQL